MNTGGTTMTRSEINRLAQDIADRVLRSLAPVSGLASPPAGGHSAGEPGVSVEAEASSPGDLSIALEEVGEALTAAGCKRDGRPLKHHIQDLAAERDDLARQNHLLTIALDGARAELHRRAKSCPNADCLLHNGHVGDCRDFEGDDIPNDDDTLVDDHDAEVARTISLPPEPDVGDVMIAIKRGRTWCLGDDGWVELGDAQGEPWTPPWAGRPTEPIPITEGGTDTTTPEEFWAKLAEQTSTAKALDASSAVADRLSAKARTMPKRPAEKLLDEVVPSMFLSVDHGSEGADWTGVTTYLDGKIISVGRAEPLTPDGTSLPPGADHYKRPVPLSIPDRRPGEGRADFGGMDEGTIPCEGCPNKGGCLGIGRCVYNNAGLG